MRDSNAGGGISGFPFWNGYRDQEMIRLNISDDGVDVRSRGKGCHGDDAECWVCLCTIVVARGAAGVAVCGVLGKPLHIFCRTCAHNYRPATLSTAMSRDYPVTRGYNTPILIRSSYGVDVSEENPELLLWRFRTS